MTSQPTNLIESGNAALDSAQWDRARDAFALALEEEETAEALEGLGWAMWWLGDVRGSHLQLERAYAAYRARADLRRSATLATRLSRVYSLVYGNASASRGWLARSERLLDEAGPCPERGWFELMRASGAPPAEMKVGAEQAMGIGRRFGDTDLEILALAYLGLALVCMGDLDEGTRRLDEAMAAATGGEVHSLSVVGDVYCTLLTACDRAGDLQRAREWCVVADDFASRFPGTAFFAICRTFYGGYLAATGRWTEAEQELVAALHVFDSGNRAQRVDAVARLADLRIRQGRLDEAQRLIEGCEEHPEGVRPAAALLLAKGDTSRAAGLLQRRLRRIGHASPEAAPLLALLVDARLAQGDLAGARESVDVLEQLAPPKGCDSIAGRAQLAAARLELASGQDGAPHAEAAVRCFQDVDMPLELAQSRLCLAECLQTSGPDIAAAEAALALATFEDLGAARDADAAARLLRALGVRSRTGAKRPGSLSAREEEVLLLLGEGLSNERIARRLYISRRTAEHHVSSILAKLGLATRAEAAALAVRRLAADDRARSGR
jgi:DNA-binding NarL/FixJ family response regulator